MRTASKPFFYSEELKHWEKVVLISYTIISIVLGLLCFLQPNWRNAILIFYAVGTQFCIYFALYTSLRNFKSYLIWCFFGLLHLVIYLTNINNVSLKMYRGSAVSPLRNTIIILIIFQVLRFISLKLQKREFVVPPKGGGKDLIENKIVSPTDYLVLLIYFGSFAILIALTF